MPKTDIDLAAISSHDNLFRPSLTSIVLDDTGRYCRHQGLDVFHDPVFFIRPTPPCGFSGPGLGRLSQR